MAKRPKKDARKDHRRTQIKKGDLVKVISGTYTGTQGKVIEILKSRGRVRVEGVAPLKRHIAPQKNARHPEGGIIEGIGSVHISNVMLVSDALERPVRTGTAINADGSKVRVARGRSLKAEEV